MLSMEKLLVEAKKKRASDLHITVGVPPILRVVGKLEYVNNEKLTPDMTSALLNSIMNPSQQEQIQNYGEIDFSYSIPTIGRFRVNAFKQRGSIAGAIRLVDSEIPDPNILGLPPSVINLHTKKRGLILVTGPTGSGKSTTLASLIGQINKTRSCHIITLEDPIEFLHSHDKSIVNQREIGLDSKGYANALRASLRQDPDVILIGEMRDLETISIAMTAAETGHLVLSTLHTTGAISTIDRIIDAFPPHQQQQIRIQLAGVLQAIVSQQLIPSVDKKERIAAFEVLHVNQAIKNLIREQKTHQILSIMQTNKRIGMQIMDDALIELINTNKISKEQGMMFSTDSSGFERKLL